MSRIWFAVSIVLSAVATADESAILHHRYAYHESDDGRIVARIELSISRSADGIDLVIAAQCRGAEIEPALGAEGVRGENLVTATELATLLTPDQHRVTSMRPDDANTPAIHGLFSAAARAPLVRRFFGSQPGSFAERDDAAQLVQVRCRLVHADRPGRVHTTVEVLGRTRLVIAWRIDERGVARLDWIGQPPKAPAATRVGK